MSNHEKKIFTLSEEKRNDGWFTQQEINTMKKCVKISWAEESVHESYDSEKEWESVAVNMVPEESDPERDDDMSPRRPLQKNRGSSTSI